MDERTQLLQNKLILITGASGFTGKHACHYFSSIGMRVAAVVRNEQEQAGPGGVTYHRCDLLSYEQVRETVGRLQPDYVLHLGGKNSVPESWKDPILYMESNVLSVLYLLDALRDLPACRTLLVGSRLSGPSISSSYRPHHPYGLSKTLQKLVALSWRQLFDQNVILAEPSNLMGPGRSTGFCSLLGGRIVQEERGGGTPPFRVSSRQERRDFLDVRDAVRAYALLLVQGSSGEIYQVCSGTPRTLEEVTTTMLSLSGSRMTVEWGDSPTADSTAEVIKPEYLEKNGWLPLYSLRTSLEDIIRYYRDQAEGGE